jgi:hypothetical protein
MSSVAAIALPQARPTFPIAPIMASRRRFPKCSDALLRRGEPLDADTQLSQTSGPRD